MNRTNTSVNRIKLRLLFSIFSIFLLCQLIDTCTAKPSENIIQANASPEDEDILINQQIRSQHFTSDSLRKKRDTAEDAVTKVTEDLPTTAEPVTETTTIVPAAETPKANEPDVKEDVAAEPATSSAPPPEETKPPITPAPAADTVTTTEDKALKVPDDEYYDSSAGNSTSITTYEEPVVNKVTPSSVAVEDTAKPVSASSPAAPAPVPASSTDQSTEEESVDGSDEPATAVAEPSPTPVVPILTKSGGDGDVLTTVNTPINSQSPLEQPGSAAEGSYGVRFNSNLFLVYLSVLIPVAYFVS